MKRIDLEARVTVIVYDPKKQASGVRRAYDVTRTDQYGDMIRYYAAALVGAGCAKTSYDHTARRDMLVIYNSLCSIANDISRVYDLTREGAEINFNDYITRRLAESDQEVQEYISIALLAMIERAAETAELYDFPALRLLAIRNAARSAVMRYQDSNRRRLDSPINAASLEADHELIDFLTSLQSLRDFYAAQNRDENPDFWADYHAFESALSDTQKLYYQSFLATGSRHKTAEIYAVNLSVVSRTIKRVRATAEKYLLKYLK